MRNNFSFLLTEEKIIFETNPHRFLMLFPEILGIFLLLLFPKYLPLFFLKMGVFSPWILITLEGGIIILMIVIFLEWLYTKYYLTNLRLVEKRGVIGKTIVSISLDKAQDVKCKFGIIGRIFGFGDLEIESAGTLGKIIFNFVPNPRGLKERIEKSLLAFKK